jgi:hypothetical protein
VIVLFTDFGVADHYVGQMHAVLAVAAPGVPVIDLLHEVPPHDIEAGSVLLRALTSSVPEDAVFICVVDPDVGGPRWPIALCDGERWFVGPDNGLLAGVASRAHGPRYFRIPERTFGVPSATFHGRDVFAPAAAAIRLGRRDHLEAIDDERVLQTARAARDVPAAVDRIVYIDRFGNLLTGVYTPRSTARIVVGAVRVSHGERFGAVEAGRLFWYINSSGLVEIAANGASAARILGVSVGDPVTVEAG